MQTGGERKFRAHMGGCVVDQRADAKLPAGAVAWSWEGGPPWMDPASWPHGVYADGEAEAEIAAVRAEARRQAEDNNFDERGKVTSISVDDLARYRPRPPAPRPELPTGVRFAPPGDST